MRASALTTLAVVTVAIPAMLVAPASADQRGTIGSASPRCGSGATQIDAGAVDAVVQTASRKLEAAWRGGRSNTYPFGAHDGQRRATRTSAYGWTSGFYPAELWLMYERTHAPVWLRRARLATKGLLPVARWTGTHDLGFMVGLPVGLARELDPSRANRRKYSAAIRHSAMSLSRRWNSRVGAIKSDEFGGRWGLIVDSAMNAPLLMEVGNAIGGNVGNTLSARGKQHMITLARHFIRRDGSTAHRLVFDRRTGRALGSAPGQGLATSSTWSRGQAWAIYGFSRAYALTPDARLLAAATALADYWIRVIPSHCVAPWDFDATGRRVLFDSSASAIAALGLLNLSRQTPDAGRSERYRNAALATLRELVKPNWAPRRGAGPGLLQHQSWAIPLVPRDGSYAWGDAYLLHALVRDLPRDSGATR